MANHTITGHLFDLLGVNPPSGTQVIVKPTTINTTLVDGSDWLLGGRVFGVNADGTVQLPSGGLPAAKYEITIQAGASYGAAGGGPAFPTQKVIVDLTTADTTWGAIGATVTADVPYTPTLVAQAQAARDGAAASASAASSSATAAAASAASTAAAVDARTVVQGTESVDFGAIATAGGSVPTKADTGQPATPLVLNPTTDAWAISGGGLTMTTTKSSGTTAVYWQRPPGNGKIKFLSRTVKFPSTGGTTDGGAILMGAWASVWNGTGAGPNCCCHATISRTNWAYWVIDTASGLKQIAGDVFRNAAGVATPLPYDTDLTSDIWLVGDTATWRLPDGTVQRIKDSRIDSEPGTVAVDEIFLAAAATDRKPVIVRSRNNSHAVGATPPPIVVPLWLPADNGLIAATGNPAVIPSVNVLSVNNTVAVRLKVPAGKPINNIHVPVAVAGAGLAGCYAAIIEADKSRSGITADQSTVWNSIGIKAMALTSPVAAKATERFVWAAFALTGATTVPQFGSQSGVSTSAHMGMTSPGPLPAGYVTGGSGTIGTTCDITALAPFWPYVVGLS